MKITHGMFFWLSTLSAIFWIGTIIYQVLQPDPSTWIMIFSGIMLAISGANIFTSRIEGFDKTFFEIRKK